MILPLLAALTVEAPPVEPDRTADHPSTFIGPKVRGGGRFDNIRMCVATPAGTRGGPAGDISFFVETEAATRISLHFDLPVMRPILFAANSEMLQLDPSVALLFRTPREGKLDWVGGPLVGVGLHYGPDYRSEASGPGRTESFFAAGPTLGAYAGIDFPRPGKAFDFQLGISPYVQPMWGAGGRSGVVAGGFLDFSFRFAVGAQR